MSTTLARVLVPLVAVGCVTAGCTSGEDGGDETERRDHTPTAAPEPNGIADLQPARAVAEARNAMRDLHDAVYESTIVIEVDGETRDARMRETITQTGCAREMSHPELGRSWTRVIGKTMWVRKNDKAAAAMGRTPAQVELFRGRWLEMVAPTLIRGCDLGDLLPAPGMVDVVEPAGMTEVGERPGRRFRFEVAGASMTFVIATEGEPIVLSGTTAVPAGTLADVAEDLAVDGESLLVEADTGAEVEPPPDRLVIDLADFRTEPA